MSKQIYNISENNLQITNAIIEVPTKECVEPAKHVSLKNEIHSFQPEIRIARKYSNLTSLQYGSCAQKGHGVFLPLSYLSSNITNQTLVSETNRLWINHQNGVFMQNLEELWNVDKNSRHHFLCHGKSVKDILSEKYENSAPMKENVYEKLQLSYVVKPSRRTYVLAMQRSWNPEFLKFPNWETVQSSLLPLIYSLQAGDELAVVSFDQETAQVDLQPTLLTEDNRVLLHAAIPRQPVTETNFSSEACHHCCLQQIQRLHFSPDVRVQIIWLVHSGKFDFHDELTSNHGHQVIGLDSSLDSSWSNLTPDTYVLGHCRDKITCQGSLTRYLMETVQSQDSHYVHQNIVNSGKGELITKIEHKEDILVVLTTENERNIAFLKSEEGSSIYSHNMAILKLPSKEAKDTDLEAKMYNANDSFTLDMYTRQSGPIPMASAWATVVFDEQYHHPTVILYASSLHGKITRATAQVSRPTHRGQKLPDVQVQLTDHGTGYPDLKVDDNIFSGYFTELSPEAGFYQVYVTIEYDDLADEDHRNVLSTSFHLPQSNFYVRKEEGSRLLVNDVFPPNRITDLSVMEDSFEGLFVTLNWTAPGGDFDHGSAFRYEIRCATSQEALGQTVYRDQSIPVHTSLIPEPLPVGSKQQSTVGVPWHNQIFFYAIVAIDASGNRGQISNVISTLIPLPAEAESNTDSKNEVIDDISTQKPTAQPYATPSTMVWTPILVLVVLSLLVTGTVLVLRKRGFCIAQVYVCDEKHDMNNSSVTSDAGVSTVTTSSSDEADELSIDMSLDIKKSVQGNSHFTPVDALDFTPTRVHIIEDYMVYRDLSVQSQVVQQSYDYWKLDQMLSALIASNKGWPPQPPSDSSSRHESLV